MPRATPLMALAFAAAITMASTLAGQDRDSVLQVMKEAADWQLAHPSEHRPDDWTQAAFYTGVIALAEVSGDARYFQAMRAMGEKNNWRPGSKPGHADDHAVIATYAALFKIDKDKRQLAPA